MRAIPCPNCQAANSVRLWAHRRDRFLMRRGDTRQIRFVLCLHCGLAYANPQLDPDEIARLYTESYRDVAVDGAHLDLKENQSRERITWLLTDYRKIKSRVLEIGCSEGVLLRQMRDGLNYSVTGIEPFGPYARFGIEQWNLKIHMGFFPLPQSMEPFDLVTFIHVIEHIPDPPAFFLDVARALSPGGYAFFETPNLWSPKIGRVSANLFAAPHLAIFSPRSVRWMLEQCGFEIEKFEADLNLRVLARYKGGTIPTRLGSPPPRDLKHGLQMVWLFRLARLRENALLVGRRFRSLMSK